MLNMFLVLHDTEISFLLPSSRNEIIQDKKQNETNQPTANE